jgi:hypothetical protein
MSITKLFLVRNGAGSNKEPFYSSTAYPELTSTTFKLGNRDYCIHCGNAALPVQAHTKDDNFDNSGCRCTCEKSMEEMAERLAFEMGDFSEELSMNRTLDNMRISSNIVQSIVARTKSLSIDLFTHRNNGMISLGKVGMRFLHENKYEIKKIVKDSYYDYYSLSMFMKLVHTKFDNFIVKSEELHTERLQNYSKVRTENFFLEPSIKEDA